MGSDSVFDGQYIQVRETRSFYDGCFIHELALLNFLSTLMGSLQSS